MKNKIVILLASALALPFTLAAQTAAPSATNTPPKLLPPPSYFTGVVSLGVTFTRGNSRTTTATADVNATHKTNTYELLLGADASYGRSDSVVNNESIDGHGQYNRLATYRFYWGVKVDALADGVAGIDYRLTLAPMVGYYFIKTTNNSLAGEVGPAVVLQKLGNAVDHAYATLRAGERYEHKFSATAKLWQSLEIYPQVDYFKNYYVNGEIGIEAAFNKRWALRTYLDDTYYHIPAVGRQKNDAKLVSALAYKF